MKEQSASGVLGTTIDKIKDLVDCKTIIGDTIEAGDGIKVIPVSKVTYGFASGGSDFPSKTRNDLFGGGGGAGVTITPVAFLVIKNGDVSVKYVVSGEETSVERLLGMVPDVIEKVTGIIDKVKGDKTDPVDEAIAQATAEEK